MASNTNKPTISVGDTFKTNCQGTVEVIYYNNANDIGVRFSDGYERSTTSGNIRKGKIRHPNRPVLHNGKRKSGEAIQLGREYTSNAGNKFTVISYVSAQEIGVVFESGYSTTASAQRIHNGSVTDRLSPSLLGVGIMGVGEYDHNHLAYTYWNSMICRGFSAEYKEAYPTYVNVTVCDEWLNYQTFANWAVQQIGFGDKGFVLDKDILLKRNKTYSPDTCVFVPHQINSLLVKADAMRGEWPIGVYFDSKKCKLAACVRINGSNKTLGYFKTAEDAFNAYKVAKEKYIKHMADKHRDSISVEAFNALYNYEVEITD